MGCKCQDIVKLVGSQTNNKSLKHDSMTTFDTDSWSFLFPFLDLYHNSVCLVWIVQNNIPSKNLKNSLLYDSFILIMQVVLQYCLLSMFLYVVATKVVTHFSNDGKGLKVYRQETQ